MRPVSHRLITIPFSHYCEKARWALDWCRVPYVEEGHLPMLHWGPTRRAGGGRTVPVLVTASDGVLADSTDILRWADARAAEGRGLYPTEEALAIEERLDDELGPHARRAGYYYTLDDKTAIAAIAGGRVPAWELWAMRLARPLAVASMRRGMRIDAEGLRRSLTKVDASFAAMDALLSDGRRWLAGDRPSAADLTFAALAAPLLCPPEHPVPLPVDGWAPAFHALRDRLRATRAGQHALRTYAEQRHTR